MEFNSTDLFDSTEPPTCGKPVLNAAFPTDLVSEVYNMDCIAGMKEYPDKYFDLALVDPPYGIGESSNDNQSRSGLAKSKNYGKKFWDNEPPQIEYFTELIRVSKNQVVWGANHFISRLPYDASCWLVWDKVNGENDFADCELAWTSFNKAVRKFTYRWHGMLQQNMKDKEARIHPTQKPISLYEWILLRFAEKGQKVLDTHLGSGSSRIAAHNLGFHFVGFELDKEYYEAQEKRFRTHISQQRLF
jgi:site-specific DNA-methyltransferase (adenine-specific)